MDVLQLFAIAGPPAANSASILTGFLPVKTWNVERADRQPHPGRLRPDNPDNAAVAGPDSIYDYYV